MIVAVRALRWDFAPLESTLRDLDPVARLRMAIGAFVRFSAEMPELSRLMLQEGKQSSWRLDYIMPPASQT